MRLDGSEQDVAVSRRSERTEPVRESEAETPRLRKPGRLVGCSCERSERLAEADVAQLAERVLGKDEVTSSILVVGSSSEF